MANFGISFYPHPPPLGGGVGCTHHFTCVMHEVTKRGQFLMVTRERRWTIKAYFRV